MRASQSKPNLHSNQSCAILVIEGSEQALEFIIDQILPRNQLHILAGSSGVGKSTIMFQLLDRIRRGEDILGRRSHPAEILYVASDRVQESYDTLFQRLDIEPFPMQSIVDIKAERISRGKDIRFDVDQWFWMRWLEQTLRVHHPKPSLIVFDTSLFILPIKNFNSQRDVMEGMTYMAAWCKANSVTAVCSMHTNKTKKTEDFLNPFNRISGSHGLLGYASTKCIIFGEEEYKHGPVMFLQGQHFPDERIYLERRTNGSLIERTNPVVNDEPIVSLFERGKPLSAKEIQVLSLNRFGWHPSTSKRHIAMAKDKGYIRVSGRGHYVLNS